MIRNATALAVVLAVCSAIPGRAEAQEMVLKLDPALTTVDFTLGDILHTVHGAFRLKSGAIRFDPATGKAGGELVVDATSGASGSDARDHKMQKNILESDRFPDITFVPDRFEGALSLSGPSSVKLHGMFGIHGTQHELVLPVQVQAAPGQLVANTRFIVPYVQWGMKNPSTFILRVNDKVDIAIHAVGHLTQP